MECPTLILNSDDGDQKFFVTLIQLKALMRAIEDEEGEASVVGLETLKDIEDNQFVKVALYRD